MKKAWIIQGGWDGHEPVAVSERFAGLLRGEGFEVEIFDTLQVMADRRDELNELDLLVPVWTMGSITGEQSITLPGISGFDTWRHAVARCDGGRLVRPHQPRRPRRRP